METHLDAMLAAVEQCTQISTQQIINSRSTEAVSARHLLIALLYEQGYTPRSIAKHLNMSTRAVSYAITRFSDRKAQLRYLYAAYEAIKKQFGNEPQ